MKATTKSSDIVMRGLVLLALMVMLAFAGFAIFFRKPSQPPTAVKMDVRTMAATLVQIQPAPGFPAALGPLFAVADELPSTPGWRIRYQAVCTLAHRGSSKVRWDIYRELLDEHRQFCNFREQLKDGREVIEESRARQMILRGLADLATWHNKQDDSKKVPSPQLLEVYRAVDKLAQSSVPELSNQAQKTKATFFK